MVASDWRLVHMAGQSAKTVLTIIGYISAEVECSLSLVKVDIWWRNKVRSGWSANSPVDFARGAECWWIFRSLAGVAAYLHSLVICTSTLLYYLISRSTIFQRDDVISLTDLSGYQIVPQHRGGSFCRVRVAVLYRGPGTGDMWRPAASGRVKLHGVGSLLYSVVGRLYLGQCWWIWILGRCCILSFAGWSVGVAG